MNISVNWLKEYTAWGGAVEDLVELLTGAGLEVEGVAQRGADFPEVVVAQILASDPHPNADRLSVCRVDDGSGGEPRQIVCGAKNYQVGDKVPLARPGAVLPGDFRIKVGKLRGVESEGMLCSGKELGLAADADGLLILAADAPVGAPIGSLFPPDVVLTVEITPNRPDWLSHVGVARELAAVAGAEFRLPTIAVPAATADSTVTGIAAPDACPFYSVRRIRGVKVAPSPDWLRGRLEAVGLRPINNVVDITNYVMLEWGQPLHAFDAAKVDGAIAVRSAARDETLTALDGAEYQLSERDLVIADARGALAIAGVMGGETSGVTDATTEILLESAWFTPGGVRRTARTLGLSTDSSYRFERGVDPGGVLRAAARAAELILELAGGECDDVVVAGELPAKLAPVRLRPERCRALLGIDLAEDEMARALTALGLARGAGDEWTIPTFRADLVREVDLIEEVIRLVGIERVAGTIEGAPAPSSDADRAYDAGMVARQRLVAAGFSEARTSTLVGRAARGSVLALRNPLGEEQSVLRPGLIDGLLAALQRNRNSGAASVRLFEVGRVFADADEEQVAKLALVMTGPLRDPNWRDAPTPPADLADIKGVVASLVPVAEWRPADDSRFAVAVEIFAGENVVGVAGQLSPAAARALDARDQVMAAELRFDAVQAAIEAHPTFAAIPRFPAVSRDVAAVAPRDLPWARIEDCVRAENEPLLESIQPFDIFMDPTGEKLAANAKSLAFSLTFRAAERTLTTDEVNAICDRLKARLRSDLAIDFRE